MTAAAERIEVVIPVKGENPREMENAQARWQKAVYDLETQTNKSGEMNEKVFLIVRSRTKRSHATQREMEEVVDAHHHRLLANLGDNRQRYFQFDTDYRDQQGHCRLWRACS